MNIEREPPARLSWMVIASVAGLLGVLVIAGAVGIATNRNVTNVANQALHYDVRLEDPGDDLRVAVLDVRHYHRNIIFAGPSRGGLAAFERAYLRLQAEIDRLEQVGVPEQETPSPAALRQMAERYYAAFRPAIDLFDTDNRAFTTASDAGLVRLDELAQATQQVDQLGEERAEAALQEVERSSRAATFDLVAVLIGLAAVSAVLAYLVIRTTNAVRVLYAEQQAMATQLAAALQSKNAFIADASHELRTPLTILRGNAEVGLELKDDCVHAPILEDIVKESVRMTGLVEDLLFLARSDSDAVPLRIERVTAADLLAELIEPAELLARHSSASVEVVLRGTGELDIDPVRIEQAILILVDNAVKYGADGGPITLSSATQGSELVIAVADHGPGIPEEELPRIFERFYRVDKTRARKLGGTGLGLAIARRIVDAHGGRIEATSRLGVGTTMRIFLPLSTEPTPEGD